MDFTSKLSLYDILTMLVSGFLILVLFIPMPEKEYQWFFIIVSSYLIGIIYHRLLEWVRNAIACCCKNEKGIRIFKTIFTSNASEAIKRAKEKIDETNYDTISDEDIKKEYIDTYYSVMDKPCYSNISLLETQEAFLRNITWMIFIYIIVFCCNSSDSSIGIEFILYLKKSISHCCFCLGTMKLLFFLTLFARYQTQKKIYELVWEGAKY